MQKVTNLYSPSEMELLLEQFTPLVKAIAWRYCQCNTKYRIEKDDLIQEGYLALMRLIPQCEDRKYLASFLKDRLSAYVWAAAERLKKQKWGDDGKDVVDRLDDDIEYNIRDETNVKELDELELDDICARALSERQLKIIRLLLKGYTRRDIAEELDISHQAVNSIITKIKKKLAPHLEACRSEGENKGAERLLCFLRISMYHETRITSKLALFHKLILF